MNHRSRRGGSRTAPTLAKPIQLSMVPCAKTPYTNPHVGDRVMVDGRPGIVDCLQPEFDQNEPRVCFVVGPNLEWGGWIELSKIQKGAQPWT